MRTHFTLPSEYEPYSLDQLVSDCECLADECGCHGIDLHPEHHALSTSAPAPFVVTDQTMHLLDGYSEYGD